MNTYTNNNPQDSHAYKEQVNIKYEATKAIVGKFPNGTAALIKLLSKAKRKGDDPKSEDKDSNTSGTTGAHVEDTTTHEDTTTPSRGASLGTDISETNQALSRQLRMVDELLGAHPVNNDFLNNTNPTDVSIYNEQ